LLHRKPNAWLFRARYGYRLATAASPRRARRAKGRAARLKAVNGRRFWHPALPPKRGRVHTPSSACTSAGEFVSGVSRIPRDRLIWFFTLSRPDPPGRAIARLGLTISRRAANNAPWTAIGLKRLAREAFRLQRNLPTTGFRSLLAKPARRPRRTHAPCAASLDQHFVRFTQHRSGCRRMDNVRLFALASPCSRWGYLAYTAWIQGPTRRRLRCRSNPAPTTTSARSPAESRERRPHPHRRRLERPQRIEAAS